MLISCMFLYMLIYIYHIHIPQHKQQQSFLPLSWGQTDHLLGHLPASQAHRCPGGAGLGHELTSQQVGCYNPAPHPSLSPVRGLESTWSLFYQASPDSATWVLTHLFTDPSMLPVWCSKSLPHCYSPLPTLKEVHPPASHEGPSDSQSGTFQQPFTKL